MDIKCKVSKIMFQQPADQVPDWDDRMRTVKWVDVPKNMLWTFSTKRKVSRDFNHKSGQAYQAWLPTALTIAMSHHFLLSWKKEIVHIQLDFF